jgi:hypothetical protein
MIPAGLVALMGRSVIGLALVIFAPGAVHVITC